MTKPFVPVFSVFLLIAAATGQTAADLANKYHHHEVYEVQPGVQMIAKFASNGLVCEMQVEQTHFVKDGVDFRNNIEEDSVHDLIDRLVPSSERGERDAKMDRVQGWGPGITETEAYSNVVVEISSSYGTYIISIDWRYRSCER